MSTVTPNAPMRRKAGQSNWDYQSYTKKTVPILIPKTHFRRRTKPVMPYAPKRGVKSYTPRNGHNLIKKILAEQIHAKDQICTDFVKLYSSTLEAGISLWSLLDEETKYQWHQWAVRPEEYSKEQFQDFIHHSIHTGTTL